MIPMGTWYHAYRDNSPNLGINICLTIQYSLSFYETLLMTTISNLLSLLLTNLLLILYFNLGKILALD
jgi:hypothetical protein